MYIGLSLILLSLFSFNALALPVLKIGFVDYPPHFVKLSDSTASGIIVERLNRYLKKDFKIIWVELPLLRAIESLNQSEIDIFSSFAFSKKRANLVDFLETPLFYAQPVICTKHLKERMKGESHLNYLKSKRLLMPRGTIAIKYFSAIQDIEIKTIDYSGNYIFRAVSMLDNNSIDFTMLASVLGQEEVIKKKGFYCQGIGEKAIFHLAFKKGNPLKHQIEKLKIAPVNYE